MEQRKIKVVVVDDDAFVAASLKTILEASKEVEVLRLGKNGKEAIALYKEYEPDVLLMDIRMEVMSGLEAGEEILKTSPEARILYLTTFSDDEYIVQALRIGAKGYILKQDYEGIVPAIRVVSSGQSVFGGQIINKIPSLMQNTETADYESWGLSEKEFEIVEAVARGLNNKEIAEELYLGEGTVRNYLSGILSKLDLRDRTQLAVFYYQKR